MLLPLDLGGNRKGVGFWRGHKFELESFGSLSVTL